MRQFPEFIGTSGWWHNVIDGCSRVSQDWFSIVVEPDTPLEMEVRELPGAEWDWVDRGWRVPATPESARCVLEIAEAFDIAIKPLALLRALELTDETAAT